MGNFYGHVTPGAFFILFGVWWMIQIWRNYFRSLIKHGGDIRFRNELCPPVKIRDRKINIEAILIVVFTVCGMLIEFRYIFLEGEIGIGRTQHGTMYIFFCSLGIFKLCHSRLQKSLPNIDEIEYVLLALALTVEAILFKFHLMERDMLDTTIHVLLVYTIYGCVIFTLAEMAFRDHVLLGLSRAFFMLLQGTWFVQVAFILYSPVPSQSGVYNISWDHENHEHIMLSTCIYTWHVGGIFLLFLACGGVMSCFYRGRGDLTDAEMTLVQPVANGYRHLVSHVDDEDEK